MILFKFSVAEQEILSIINILRLARGQGYFENLQGKVTTNWNFIEIQIICFE